MAAKFLEKRKFPRTAKNLPLKISDSTFNIITETKNISGCGAYCSVDRFIPTLTKLAITLLVPSIVRNRKNPHRIKCEGVVVRSEPPTKGPADQYHIAIFFNNIERKNAEIIANYVNWHLKGLKN